jgi:ABC-2 type transport system permease protein
MENLLAMPASPLEIMLGKVLPYPGRRRGPGPAWCWWLPKRCSACRSSGLWLLLVSILIFVLALVLLGYAISTLARTQMQAMQLTFFFFLPSLLLSGFMFPFRGMPGWAQALGEIFPLTHFLSDHPRGHAQGRRSAGVAAPLAALMAFVALYMVLALMRFRRTLD